VLLGPSGCGKSTLLKAVGGYMTPSEGKMRISGREISEPGADRMMIFQEFRPAAAVETVLENVMFPLLMTRRLPRKDAEARARAYIEKVSLTRVLDSYRTRCPAHEAARRDRARHGDGAGYFC